MDQKKEIIEIMKGGDAEVTPKKVWTKPFFEIFSKDVIKSGTAPGAESSVTHYTGHVHYS
jgi:hypothetical protein